MGIQGDVEIDFGAAPGTNHASVVVIGQAGIYAGAAVEAWLMAESSTDHNAVEQRVIDGNIRCGDIVVNTSFKIYADMNVRLTGKIKVRWVWN